MEKERNKIKAYQGFEEIWHEQLMTGKMILYVLVFVVLVQIAIFFLISYYQHPELYKYIKQSKSISELKLVISAIFSNSQKAAKISMLAWLILPISLYQFKKRAKKQIEKKHLRGAKIVKKLRVKGKKDISIGNVKMPVDIECEHVFICGRPGVGKTVLLSQVIERVRERMRERKGAKAIIYDFKGDFVSRFYDKDRDILFNPLDKRCVGWSVFNEIQTMMDIDAVAHSLIPPAYQADPFWNDAARDVLGGILRYLHLNNTKNNKDIWNAVSSSILDIERWLRDTKGAERGHVYIQDASSKQAMGVHSVMMQYCKAFEFMSNADGDFSIKDWLESDKSGFIFVTNYADIKDTLRPILSLFVDLLARKLLSMKDDFNRRVFFFLDEFGTLQRLSSIINLLTLSRSKGGSVWIGIQDIGQIDKLYTKDHRIAITNSCGTYVMFSVSDPETARFLSDKIGDAEYEIGRKSVSMGPETYRDGISIARERRVEKVLLASEIMNLEKLRAYLKLSGYDITKIKLKIKNYKDINEPILIRDDVVLDDVKRSYKNVKEKSIYIVDEDTKDKDINF